MSKVLTIYSTSHGTTESVANRIHESIICAHKEIVNIKNLDKNISIDSADFIILGTSIHAGAINKSISKFIEDNMSKLKDKKVAIFLCCMNEPAEQEQLYKNFPLELIDSSIVCSIVGGEFIFEKMNFVEKLLVKKIAGVKSSISKLRNNEIDEFVSKINYFVK
jgi:menaquinone-dependent protoporphyrinogen oxidase